MPVLPTIAFPGAVELHIPPTVASLSDNVGPPAHTDVDPLIAPGADGNGFTVTSVVAVAEPQLLVIV